MIKYKERTLIEDGKLETINLKAAFSIPNWSPPIPPLISTQYQVPSYSRRTEQIWWDDGRSWDNGYHLNKGSWKPCQHYTRIVADSADVLTVSRIPWVSEALIGSRYYSSKDTTDTLDRLVATDHPTFRSLWGRFGEHNAQLPPMSTKQTKDGIIAEPAGLRTLVDASLKTCLPSIKSELSLINSIIELKDFRTLGRTLASSASLFRKLTENRAGSHLLSNVKDRLTTDVLRESSVTVVRMRSKEDIKKAVRDNPHAFLRSTFDVDDGLTLREALHSTADGYLQAKFNLIPLFRDIMAIQKAIRDVGKQINWLVNNQGKRQMKHYAHRWLNGEYSGANQVIGPLTYTLGQFAGSAGTGTGMYRSYAHSLKFERRVIVDPSHFHAEIEFNYYFTQAQTEHAQLYGLYDALGINLDPAIIWNAIPWSFVVDWLFSVSKWLSRRKVLNLEPGINISRYLWSWKQTRRVVTFFESTTNLTPRPARTYLPTLYETIYRRDIKMPSRTDSLFGSGLSSQELSLGAALIITSALHPSRRQALTWQKKKIKLYLLRPQQP